MVRLRLSVYCVLSLNRITNANQEIQRLAVWQKGVTLVTGVYRLTDAFPRNEQYGLVSQMRRAAVSVPANIAEGYGRATRGEYRNQLSVATGSLFELETLLIISQRLEFTRNEAAIPLQSEITELQKMLWKMRQRLGSKPKPWRSQCHSLSNPPATIGYRLRGVRISIPLHATPKSLYPIP